MSAWRWLDTIAPDGPDEEGGVHMHFLLPLLEFLVLGVSPIEFLTPGAQGPALLFLAVAIDAALTWLILRGTALWPITDQATGAGRAMRCRSDRLPVLTLRDPDAAGSQIGRAHV